MSTTKTKCEVSAIITAVAWDAYVDMMNDSVWGSLTTPLTLPSKNQKWLGNLRGFTIRNRNRIRKYISRGVTIYDAI